mgnify:CR=1 FL=1
MKFEIRDNDFVDSFALIIPVQEFVKAKDEPREFKSLCIAVDGFLDAFDANDRDEFDEQEYDAIYSWLGKSGNIFFVLLEDRGIVWHEIYIVANSDTRHIRYMDSEGYVNTHINSKFFIKRKRDK